MISGGLPTAKKKKLKKNTGTMSDKSSHISESERRILEQSVQHTTKMKRIRRQLDQVELQLRPLSAANNKLKMSR